MKVVVVVERPKYMPFAGNKKYRVQSCNRSARGGR
jgi:hypothetical protein